MEKLKIYQNNSDEKNIFIADVEFEDTPLGECKTRYGETFFSCYMDKIDPEQIVQAYTYWNGSNMESVILNNGEIPWFIITVERIDKEEEERILKDLPDPSPQDYEYGYALVENGGYNYMFTQYPHWAICEVCEEI